MGSTELPLPAGAARAQGGTPGSPGPPQGDTAAQSPWEDRFCAVISLVLPPCRAQGPLLLAGQKPSPHFMESWNYRLMESFTLAKIHRVQPFPQHCQGHHWTLSPSATSTHLLNPSRGGYSTSARAGQPFPWRNFPEHPTRILWCNLEPFPFVLSKDKVCDPSLKFDLRLACHASRWHLVLGKG